MAIGLILIVCEKAGKADIFVFVPCTFLWEARAFHGHAEKSGEGLYACGLAEGEARAWALLAEMGIAT